MSLDKFDIHSGEYSESLICIAGKLREMKNVRWSDFADRMNDIAASLSREDSKVLFMDEGLFSHVFEQSGHVRWIKSRALDAMLPVYPDIGEFLILNSPIQEVKSHALALGLYENVSIFNHVALNETGEMQVLGAANCDIKTLRKLKGSKDHRVRKVYFSRLGAVECLDQMLDDKKAEIRGDGIRLAPYYYDRLKNLTKEIARTPFSLLVDKISPEYIPMLLANRNVSNTWIKRKLESRMIREQTQIRD